MKLYVIRHGQTDANLNHIITARKEVPLNETGVEQAKETAKRVAHIPYEMVYCSPMIRTRQTMEIVNVKDKPVIYDDRLIERDAGSIEGRYSRDLDMSRYWNIHQTTGVEGAETIPEIVERVSSFLQELKQKETADHVLIVTHDGICRAITYYFKGEPEHGDMYHYAQNNAEIREFTL